MGWLDLALLAMFGGLLTLAYNRGLVLELADFLALLLGGTLACRLYRGLASGLNGSILKAWNLAFLQKFIFFSILLVCFLVIYGAGLTIDRRLNEERVLDKEVSKNAGLAFGVFKSLWLLTLLLGLFFYNGLVSGRQAPALRKGAVVRLFSGMSSFVAPTVYVMAPADLASKFMTRGFH